MRYSPTYLSFFTLLAIKIFLVAFANRSIDMKTNRAPYKECILLASRDHEQHHFLCYNLH